MESKQINKIKEIISLISSSRQESLIQAFLIGTAYSRYKMDEQVLSAFTQGFEQIVQFSQSMNRQDILEELYSTLISGKEITPIKFIENLTDRLFQTDEQYLMKLNSNVDEEEMYKKMIEEEQAEELQKQQLDEMMAREAAFKMEEEDRKLNNISKEIEKMDNENWKCEICLEQMTDSEFIPLECSHQYHKSCLAQYLNTKINDRNFPLKCPHSKCNKEIEYAEIRAIITFKEFQKYEEFQLNTYIDSNPEEMSWCPSAGCKYAFVLEDGQTQLICPLCRKRFCLTCRCEYHKGQTCKEYQLSNTFSEEDKKFVQFVKGQKFKQCTSCKMWVEKNQGCDHMSCRCGNQFCYRCGGPYQRCECVQRR